MTALNLNTYYGCESCAYADQYGNGCKKDLLLPILNMMAHQDKCGEYKYQNKE